MLNFTPPKMGKFTPATFGLIAGGIFVIILLSTSVFIVDQTERAVITRFGRFIGIRTPGLHFKLPFGIDRNFTVDVTSVHSQEFGRTARGGPNRESTMLTGDLNIVNVEWIIQYRIEDPVAWTFNVVSHERIRTIRDVSRSVINMQVGDRAIMDIMGRDRNEIQEEARVTMNEMFRRYGPPGSNGLGINVITVQLQNVTPPAGVQQAFEDVNRAMQDLERLVNEGMQIYNEEIPRTRGEAERIIQLAQGYATERVNRARGSAARFNSVFEEYLLAPEVTRQRLYFEMMEEVFSGDERMVLIDRNLTNFLPLMNLGGAR